MAVELEKYSKPLIRFALSLTGDLDLARDLAQETILRALRSKKQLDQIAQLKAWLFSILINAWRDDCRRRARRPRHDAILENQLGKSLDPQMGLEKREELEQVLNYFCQLPETQRQVIHLRAVEGFSIAEIAEMLGTNSNNVKTNLSLARKKLRQKFDPSPFRTGSNDVQELRSTANRRLF